MERRESIINVVNMEYVSRMSENEKGDITTNIALNWLQKRHVLYVLLDK